MKIPIDTYLLDIGRIKAQEAQMKKFLPKGIKFSPDIPVDENGIFMPIGKTGTFQDNFDETQHAIRSQYGLLDTNEDY